LDRALSKQRFPHPDAKYVLLPGETIDGIRHIGTNALPYLVEMIRKEQPPWKLKVVAFLDMVLGRLNPAWGLHEERLQSRGSVAFIAFQSFGTNAQPAMPYLYQLENHSNESVRVCATNLIRYIQGQSMETTGK